MIASVSYFSLTYFFVVQAGHSCLSPKSWLLYYGAPFFGEWTVMQHAPAYAACMLKPIQRVFRIVYSLWAERFLNDLKLEVIQTAIRWIGSRVVPTLGLINKLILYFMCCVDFWQKLPQSYLHQEASFTVKFPFSWLIVPRLQKTLEAVLETEIAINKTECMYDQTIVKWRPTTHMCSSVIVNGSSITVVRSDLV